MGGYRLANTQAARVNLRMSDGGRQGRSVPDSKRPHTSYCMVSCGISVRVHLSPRGWGGFCFIYAFFVLLVFGHKEKR
jgi:hypothetical protein